MNKFFGRSISPILIILILLSVTSQAQNEFNLMPYPHNIKAGNGRIELNKTFTVSVIKNTDRLENAATHFLRRLSGRTGLFFSQNKIDQTQVSDTATLLIDINRRGLVELDEDESYSIKIKNNQILLNAETDLGAMHGLETLLQLLSAESGKYYFPEVEIHDEPRFPWRGLLMDVSRHWLPVEVLQRNMNGMAAMKMNVLHLHLTEDQGFRIESKVFPKLHELGSSGKYYTQQQIREIIKYADDRGIRVVPEFDMPGHATSWFVGYPELASAPGPYQIETRYGVMDPVMDPSKESTYQFLESFLTEMSELFTDRFMHIGGDENNGKQWDANEKIQAFMSDKGMVDNHQLQSYFINRVLDILDKNGKRMMGWDEIFQPGISKDILIQSWRGKEALIEAAENGYQAILSNGYYIDLAQPASFHYLNDPLDDDWGLNANESQNILGGEATMWSEMVTQETVDSRIWPRTAVIAERLWSPGDIKDVDDMYRRLEIISYQLEEVGLQHISYYEMMLRRLAGGINIESVKTLVDVIEPLERYQRHNQRVSLSTYAPFTRLADAAAPESMEAYYFNKLVDEFIATEDITLTQEIKVYFLKWVDNHKAFIELAETSPVLGDAVTLSLDLSNISKIGLQAFSTTVTHSDRWKEQSNKALNAALEPRMECELKVVEAVRKLVEYAK